MSTNFRHIDHPLRRGGLSRPERDLSALATDTAPLDGRSLGDLLRFWYDYARQVNFHTASTDRLATQVSGDWLDFFRRSHPFQYANIGAFDLEAIDERFRAIEDGIEARRSFTSLNPLLDLLLEMAGILADWRTDLTGDQAGLLAVIDGLIETNLSESVGGLIGLVNGAAAWGYQPGVPLANFQAPYGLALVDTFAADRTISGSRGSTKKKVLAGRDLLADTYRLLWKALEATVATARDDERIEESLRQPLSAGTPPHLGLVFSFLLLYQEAQAGLNRLSDKHLDFFYRDTLQLRELPLVNDQAHLIFELGKRVEDSIVVEKGRRFKAGKDEAGTEVIFATQEDLVLTKTQVVDTKTFFLEPEHPDDPAAGQLYAAPIAASGDGLGGDFPKETTPAWPTLGAAEATYPDPETEVAASLPLAKMGLVLASPVLLLREGTRTVTVALTLGPDTGTEPMENIPAAVAQSLFVSYFSTEEGWTLAPSPHVFIPTPDEGAPTVVLEMKFTLPADFPAVINPGSEVLIPNNAAGFPALRLDFNLELTRRRDLYCRIGQLPVREVAVDVLVCGVKDLRIENDFATLDPSKAFQPFGPFPKAESSNFFVGSEEIFVKRWSQIDLRMTWMDVPCWPGYYDCYDSGLIWTPEKIVGDVSLRNLLNWEATDLNHIPLLPAISEQERYDCELANQEKKVAILAGEDEDYYIDLLTDAAEYFLAHPDVLNPIPPTRNRIDELAGIYFMTLDLTSQAAFIGDKIDGIEPSSDVDLTGLESEFTRFKTTLFGFSKIILDDFVPPDDPEVIPLKGLNNYGPEEKVLSITELPQLPLVEFPLNLPQNISSDALSGVIRLQLRTQDFLHDEYPQALLTTADKNAKKAERDLPLLPVLNAPYTPIFSSISIDYAAHDSLEDDLQFGHLHPWEETYEWKNTGAAAGAVDALKGAGFPLLPTFPGEGHLYLGLASYQPGELLNLYFELDPATADPRLEKARVEWAYLRGNEWCYLEDETQVLADTTAGLIQPGIVKIAPPSDMSRVGTTILNPAYHWLRASVAERSAAIAATLRVSTQVAVVVAATTEAHDAGRLAVELPAGSIAKVVAPLAGLKAIEQPYPGFGGRAPEAPEKFNRRVSELLRHKGRAITLNDYERIVLEAFPNVYRVKCLTHTLGVRGDAAEDVEMAPGHVTLVVVPDLTRVNAVNPFEPRLPAAELEAIRTFLLDKISPCTSLFVLNPEYEPVRLSLCVRFGAGRSTAFYRKQLQRDLRTLLAPWTQPEAGADITFGGRFYYSTAVRFVEELDYVDYVENLSIDHPESGPGATFQAAVHARSVLTTANGPAPDAASRNIHDITVIEA